VTKNLDYHDLWHELYYTLKRGVRVTNAPSTLYDPVIDLMEEMDPRLVEEEEMAQQVAEAVKIFLKP
jgi:hypothetical protein